MGFFAILAAEGTPADQKPFIRRCHLNLWSLPSAVPRRRLFYLDIGVEVQAHDTNSVTAVQVLLPFRAEEGAWPDKSRVVQDLYSTLTDNESCELVFGGPVEHEQLSNEYRLQVGDYPDRMKIIRVNPNAARLAEGFEVRSDSTLLNIELSETIEAGTSAYFRIRCRVFGASPLWRWTRLTGGAQVDFRMCDVRESLFVDTERHLRARILDIDQANFFLMAPARLELGARSPEFKYLRSLETGAWKTYLKGASHFGSGGDLLVYYWQHYAPGQSPTDRSRKPINKDDPYRVYMQFQRPFARSWWTNVLQVVLAILIVWVAARLLSVSNPRSWNLSDLDVRSAVGLIARDDDCGDVFFPWAVALVGLESVPEASTLCPRS